MGTIKKILSELLVQSLEIIMTLALIGGIWLYVFRPEIFHEIIMAAGILIPIISVFAFFSLITAKRVGGIRKRMEEAEIEESGVMRSENIEISVSQQDEIKNDIIAFFSAIFIIGVAKLMNNDFDFSDIIQAFIAMVAVYSTKKTYFKDLFSWTGKRPSKYY